MFAWVAPDAFSTSSATKGKFLCRITRRRTTSIALSRRRERLLTCGRTAFVACGSAAANARRSATTCDKNRMVLLCTSPMGPTQVHISTP